MEPKVIYWKPLQGPWLGDGEELATLGPLPSPSPNSQSPSRMGWRREQLFALAPFSPTPAESPQLPPPLIGICTVKSGGGEGVSQCPDPQHCPSPPL